MKIGDLVYLDGHGYRLITCVHGEWLALTGFGPLTIWPREQVEMINEDW